MRTPSVSMYQAKRSMSSPHGATGSGGACHPGTKGGKGGGQSEFVSGECNKKLPQDDDLRGGAEEAHAYGNGCKCSSVKHIRIIFLDFLDMVS